MSIARYLLIGLIAGAIFVICVHKRAVRPHALAIGLMVAACIYVLFAFRAADMPSWLAVEALGLLLFSSIAVLGVRRSLGWLALGWALHPVWDIALHYFGRGANFAPAWYVIACVSFDLLIAAYCAYLFVAGTQDSGDRAVVTHPAPQAK